MKPTEAVRLVAIVRALCPGQKLDDATPEAWEVVLGDIAYADAEQAVRTIYRDRRNVAELGYRRIEADDILAEVKAIRARRIDDADPDALVPPPDLPSALDVQWRRAAIAAVAAGLAPPDNGRAIGSRGLPRGLTAGRRVSSMDDVASSNQPK